MATEKTELFQIGELGKRVGKSARALHLYEELGLLSPATRSQGGFRLYDKSSVERVEWILRLQRSGFSLPDIQGFVRDFDAATSGHQATEHVREIFQAKLGELREQIVELHACERDLEAAIDYLDACNGCAPSLTTSECRCCTHRGHQPERVPALFAGLSESADAFPAYDVDANELRARAASRGNNG